MQGVVPYLAMAGRAGAAIDFQTSTAASVDSVR